MSTTLSLVKPGTNQDSVETLLRLLREAQDGSLVGLAYVALYKGSDYSGDVAGLAHSHPLLIMGIVRALEEVVSRRTSRKT